MWKIQFCKFLYFSINCGKASLHLEITLDKPRAQTPKYEARLLFLHVELRLPIEVVISVCGLI
jgi:hypothetical protein